MTDQAWNPWKLATFSILLVLATAFITGLVVAKWTPSETSRQATADVKRPGTGGGTARGVGGGAAAPVAGGVPTQADIAACNRYASSHVGQRDKTWEVAKDAIIGGAATAGLGAAAGAIADGGKGAGKGAAIGGLVGAAGGALYGINENRQADEAYRTAYAGCMRSRGYAG